VIHRPNGIGAFQFVILASLRAVQLTRGCRPRIDDLHGHKNTVLAQLEVAQGKVTQELTPPLSGDAATDVGAATEHGTPAILVV